MAEISTIARPYAEALFASAQSSSDGLQSTLDQVSTLSNLVALEDVRQTVTDPRLDDQQRGDLVKTLVPGLVLSAHVQNFVDLLVENDRLLLLPEIALQFQELKDEAEGVAQAMIVSAFPMSDEQVAQLVSLLEPKFNLKLKPHVTVDESLIGGVRVVVGDHVLDTSVQAQLTRMRDALVA